MQEFPEQLRIPFGEWVEIATEWLVAYGDPFFTAIRVPVDYLVDSIIGFLLFLPWPIVVIAGLAIGWMVAGWEIGIVAAVGFLLLGMLGYWELSMVTLGMILTSVLICVVIGVPLGILSARSDRFEGIVRPLLDAMQTIHPFVYLVPAVLFFGIGRVPGTITTIIFALPPIVRLTNLGIRQVDEEVIEAGKSFGATDWQLLFEVQLPLALPTILAGLNQTLMLSLSMVVIAALINGGGLGQEILRGVNRLEIGRAVASGVAVLILAVILDRISQARGGAPASQA